MKVLVVYDSVSPSKLTMKVAEAILNVLKEKGINAESFYAKDVDAANVKNYDCLIAGAPTMWLRASSGMMQFLDSFQDKEVAGKFAAAFDTQLPNRMSGNAAKGIERKLKKIGFEIVSPPLVTYAVGKMNQLQLKEGELEKTRHWTQEIADVLLKRT